jgi:small subunit ribosomal protein S20
MYRTYIKNVLKAVQAGDKALAQAAFLKAQSVVDKAAGKKLIHKNKASRIKSRLNARVKAMAS